MSLEADPANAGPHLLGTGAYEEIKRRYEGSEVPEKQVGQFVEARAERIALAMHAWCEAEECEASAALEGAEDGFGPFAPRRDTPSDILLGWGYPSPLVRRLTRVARDAYARSSSSAKGWKSSGHNRARWVEGDDPSEMKADGRAEMEVRVAGDGPPLTDLLMLSREVLSIPSQGRGPVVVSVAGLADSRNAELVEAALDRVLPSRAGGAEPRP